MQDAHERYYDRKEIRKGLYDDVANVYDRQLRQGFLISSWKERHLIGAVTEFEAYEYLCCVAMRYMQSRRWVELLLSLFLQKKTLWSRVKKNNI